MRVRYVPQRTDYDIRYVFNTDRIVAVVNGEQDVFDFSSMPDGEATKIKFTLDPCPVLAARRVNGELHVTLIRPIPARPSVP